MLIMGIPHKVKIKESFDRTTTDFGSVDSIKSEIQISDLCNKETRNATLLHEVIHVIDVFMSLKLTEEQVSGISAGLYAYFAENGYQTDWIE